MASSGKSDSSTKTGTASQNQVIRILLGDHHTEINLSAFQKSITTATEDAKFAFYRSRMSKEQQKNAKVRWDSLSKDQKENAGLGVNNEPINVENLMITLQEAYADLYLPGVNGMASVVSVYNMMTGEADIFTYLENITMRAYQMNRDKLRSMPSSFYTGADVKEPDHDTETKIHRTTLRN